MKTKQPFLPHVTVATVVERQGRFLLVEEYSHQKKVINQPAGHLDAEETLAAAAIRETFEETRWHISLQGVLSLDLYLSPQNGTTYYRTTFIGRALEEDHSATLDEGIIQPLWLSFDEIKARRKQLRSPLVLKTVEKYLCGLHHPLEILNDNL